MRGFSMENMEKNNGEMWPDFQDRPGEPKPVVLKPVEFHRETIIAIH